MPLSCSTSSYHVVTVFVHSIMYNCLSEAFANRTSRQNLWPKFEQPLIYHKIYLLYLLYGLFTDRTGGRHGQGPGEAQGVEQVAAGGAPGPAHRGQTHLVRGIIGSN